MQRWDDADFCDEYENTWEIVVDEVHYGWMAPGERSLGLLSDSLRQDAKILDVGCGMAQNLISLAKQGFSCYGLDISSCMLDKAHRLVAENSVTQNIVLQQGDMRDPINCPEMEFDAILSIYSMEYLSGIQELRKVIHSLGRHLRPGGVFILCCSHPSQVQRYPELLNRSVPQGVGKYRPYNYSFKDATEALYKSRFTIERIVEQKTFNPSKISYEESQEYPYHFRDGCNPCREQYDEFSNGAPHTVIYKARKPTVPLLSLDQSKLLHGDRASRKLWGYNRKILRRTHVYHIGCRFSAAFLAAMDNIIGLVDVLQFTVDIEDLSGNEKTILVIADESHDSVAISTDSVLGVLHKRLLAKGLSPRYNVFSVESADGLIENRLILSSIDGLHEQVQHLFATKKTGLLCFINGHEPSAGELPIDIIAAKTGDEIYLAYFGFQSKIDLNDDKQGKLF